MAAKARYMCISGVTEHCAGKRWTMPRTVTLLRHAKSSRDDPRLADINRPLAERGHNDAPRMGGWMTDNAVRPDLVLCSTSVRTRQTLDHIVRALPAGVTTRFSAALYHAEAPSLLRLLQDLSIDVRHVLVVGHNPGFYDLALRLVGKGDADIRTSLVEKFPTCGCAVITCDVDTWAEVVPESGTLTLWMSPKRLP
jgi:phosphohistidine phosphatase